MYEALCVFLCVLAVFGGYVALKAAVYALFRRNARREPEKGCAGCARRDTCGEKGTSDGKMTTRREEDGERD